MADVYGLRKVFRTSSRKTFPWLSGGSEPDLAPHQTASTFDGAGDFELKLPTCRTPNVPFRIRRNAMCSHPETAYRFTMSVPCGAYLQIFSELFRSAYAVSARSWKYQSAMFFHRMTPSRGEDGPRINQSSQAGINCARSGIYQPCCRPMPMSHGRPWR